MSTMAQRKLVRELGPYTLGKDGVLRDNNGFSLGFSLRPNANSKECAWDRAMVAVLNDVLEMQGPPR
jgi:hypothetical protein